MKDYLQKFKYIYPVFILVYLGSVLGLYLFRYVFEIKLQLIELDVMVWNFWIPLIFTALLLMVFLKPRLKILKFSEKDEDRKYFLLFIAMIFICGTAMNTQKYLYNSTGSLVEVKNYLDIKDSSVKYVKFKTYYTLNNNQAGFFADVSTSGKHSESLNFDFYFVLPFVKSVRSAKYAVSNVWYCKKFHKSISNRSSDYVKDDSYRRFYDACVRDLKNTNFNGIQYFEKVPKSKDYKNGILAIQKVQEDVTRRDKKDMPILLKPIEEDFNKRTGELMKWFFILLGLGLIVFPLFLLWPKYNKKAHLDLLSGKKVKDSNDFYDFFKFLIPKGDHFMTSLLLDSIILVYFIQLFVLNASFMTNSELLLNWGAVRKDEVFNGEYWRLFTCMFLHGGFLHVAYNALALVFVGIFMEPLLGRTRFILYYIVCGIAASLASIIWHDHTLSVGASGAIFGMIGLSIFVDYFKTKSFVANKHMIYLFGGFALVNLIYGLVVPNIDNAGHFGGFIAGIVLAYLNSIIDSEDEFAVRRK